MLQYKNRINPRHTSVEENNVPFIYSLSEGTICGSSRVPPSPFPWAVDAWWVKLNGVEQESDCPDTDVLGDANESLQPWLLPDLFSSWEVLGHRLIRLHQLYQFEEIATTLSVAFLSFRCGTLP